MPGWGGAGTLGLGGLHVQLWGAVSARCTQTPRAQTASSRGAGPPSRGDRDTYWFFSSARMSSRPSAVTATSPRAGAGTCGEEELGQQGSPGGKNTGPGSELPQGRVETRGCHAQGTPGVIFPSVPVTTSSALHLGLHQPGSSNRLLPSLLVSRGDNMALIQGPSHGASGGCGSLPGTWSTSAPCNAPQLSPTHREPFPRPGNFPSLWSPSQLGRGDRCFAGMGTDPGPGCARRRQEGARLGGEAK